MSILAHDEETYLQLKTKQNKAKTYDVTGAFITCKSLTLCFLIYVLLLLLLFTSLPEVACQGNLNTDWLLCQADYLSTKLLNFNLIESEAFIATLCQNASYTKRNILVNKPDWTQLYNISARSALVIHMVQCSHCVNKLHRFSHTVLQKCQRLHLFICFFGEQLCGIWNILPVGLFMAAEVQ